MQAEDPEQELKEKELEEAFRISAKFGVETLHANFQLVILGCIKGQGLGLSVHDIDDVYQQTMIEMLTSAAKPDFDPERPLRLAQHIAMQRTKDARRRRRLKARREGTEYLDHVIADMKGSDLAFRLNICNADWRAFDAALREEIEELPPMQRDAAICFIDVYEEVRELISYAPLAEAMGELAGKPITVSAAKSAWHEAKKKIAEDLKRRGFNFLSEIDP
jgi:DNA-directed RNA polymerase specialized sigma24 family protein